MASQYDNIKTRLRLFYIGVAGSSLREHKKHETMNTPHPYDLVIPDSESGLG
jgi:hypothetical protein